MAHVAPTENATHPCERQNDAPTALPLPQTPDTSTYPSEASEPPSSQHRAVPPPLHTPSSMRSSLQDLEELRACYEALAKEHDPYPHAAVLANRSESPGSVFDDMTRVLIAGEGGGGWCRAEGDLSAPPHRHPQDDGIQPAKDGAAASFLQQPLSKIQAQLLQWRYQLFRSPPPSTSSSSSSPSTSASYSLYRQHYALLDRTSLSLPATWVRGIMVFYKKKLKCIWSTLEADAAAAEREGNAVVTPSFFFPNSPVPRCWVAFLSASPPSSCWSPSPFRGVVPSGMGVEGTTTATAAVNASGKEEGTKKREEGERWKKEEEEEGEKSGDGDLPPPPPAAPVPFFVWNSVVLLRQVVHAHLWQPWSGVGRAELYTSTAEAHPEREEEKEEGHGIEEVVNGETKKKAEPPSSSSGVDSFTSKKGYSGAETCRLLHEHPSFLRALDLLPSLVHSFCLARGACRAILLPPSPSPLFHPSFAAASSSFFSLFPPFPFSSSSSSSSGIMFPSCAASCYPGTYRHGFASALPPPPPSHPVGMDAYGPSFVVSTGRVRARGEALLRLGAEEDHFYDDIIRSEFGNPEWLRYVFTMLLGAMQWQYPLEMKEKKKKKEKEKGNEEKCGRNREEGRAPLLRTTRHTPAEWVAAAHQLLRWSVGVETFLPFLQLLCLLFIQAQCQYGFPHLYYRELVVHLLQCGGEVAINEKEKKKKEEEEDMEKTTRKNQQPHVLEGTRGKEEGQGETTHPARTPSSTPSPSDLSSLHSVSLPRSPPWIPNAAQVCRGGVFREVFSLLTCRVPSYLRQLFPFAASMEAHQHYRAVVLLQLFGISYPSEAALWEAREKAAVAMEKWTKAWKSASPEQRNRELFPLPPPPPPISFWDAEGAGNADGNEAFPFFSSSSPLSSTSSLPIRFSFSQAAALTPALYPLHGRRRTEASGRSTSGEGPFAASVPFFPSSTASRSVSSISSSSAAAAGGGGGDGDGKQNTPPSSSSPATAAVGVGGTTGACPCAFSSLVASVESTIPEVIAGLSPDRSFLFYAYYAMLRPLLWAFLKIQDRVEHVPCSMAALRMGEETWWEMEEVVAGDGHDPSNKNTPLIKEEEPITYQVLFHRLARTAVEDFCIPVSSRLPRWEALQLGPHPPMAMNPMGRLTLPLAMGSAIDGILLALKHAVSHGGWVSGGSGGCPHDDHPRPAGSQRGRRERNLQKGTSAEGMVAATTTTTLVGRGQEESVDGDHPRSSLRVSSSSSVAGSCTGTLQGIPVPPPSVEHQLLWLTYHVLQIDLLLHSLLEDDPISSSRREEVEKEGEEVEGERTQKASKRRRTTRGEAESPSTTHSRNRTKSSRSSAHTVPRRRRNHHHPWSKHGTSPDAWEKASPSPPRCPPSPDPVACAAAAREVLAQGMAYLYRVFSVTLASLHPNASVVLAVLLVNSLHAFLMRQEAFPRGPIAHVRETSPAPLPPSGVSSVVAGRGEEGERGEDRLPIGRMETRAPHIAPPTPLPSRSPREEEEEGMGPSSSPPLGVLPACSTAAPVPCLDSPIHVHRRPTRISTSAMMAAAAGGGGPSSPSSAPPPYSVVGKRKAMSARRCFLLPISTTTEVQALLRLARCADTRVWEASYKELLWVRLMYHDDPKGIPSSLPSGFREAEGLRTPCPRSHPVNTTEEEERENEKEEEENDNPTQRSQKQHQQNPSRPSLGKEYAIHHVNHIPKWQEHAWRKDPSTTTAVSRIPSSSFHRHGISRLRLSPLLHAFARLDHQKRYWEGRVLYALAYRSSDTAWSLSRGHAPVGNSSRSGSVGGGGGGLFSLDPLGYPITASTGMGRALCGGSGAGGGPAALSSSSSRFPGEDPTTDVAHHSSNTTYVDVASLLPSSPLYDLYKWCYPLYLSFELAASSSSSTSTIQVLLTMLDWRHAPPPSASSSSLFSLPLPSSSAAGWSTTSVEKSNGNRSGRETRTEPNARNGRGGGGGSGVASTEGVPSSTSFAVPPLPRRSRPSPFAPLPMPPGFLEALSTPALTQVFSHHRPPSTTATATTPTSAFPFRSVGEKKELRFQCTTALSTFHLRLRVLSSPSPSSPSDPLWVATPEEEKTIVSSSPPSENPPGPFLTLTLHTTLLLHRILLALLEYRVGGEEEDDVKQHHTRRPTSEEEEEEGGGGAAHGQSSSGVVVEELVRRVLLTLQEPTTLVFPPTASTERSATPSTTNHRISPPSRVSSTGKRPVHPFPLLSTEGVHPTPPTTHPPSSTWSPRRGRPPPPHGTDRLSASSASSLVSLSDATRVLSLLRPLIEQDHLLRLYPPPPSSSSTSSSPSLLHHVINFDEAALRARYAKGERTVVLSHWPRQRPQASLTTMRLMSPAAPISTTTGPREYPSSHPRSSGSGGGRTSQETMLRMSTDRRIYMAEEPAQVVVPAAADGCHGGDGFVHGALLRSSSASSASTSVVAPLLGVVGQEKGWSSHASGISSFSVDGNEVTGDLVHLPHPPYTKKGEEEENGHALSTDPSRLSKDGGGLEGPRFPTVVGHPPPLAASTHFVTAPPPPSAVHLFRIEKLKIWILHHLKRVHRLSHEVLWKMIKEGGCVPLPVPPAEAAQEKEEALHQSKEEHVLSHPSSSSSSPPDATFCVRMWTIPPLSFSVTMGMFKVVVEELIEKQLVRRTQYVAPPSSSSSRLEGSGGGGGATSPLPSTVPSQISSGGASEGPPRNEHEKEGTNTEAPGVQNETGWWGKPFYPLGAVVGGEVYYEYVV